MRARGNTVLGKHARRVQIESIETLHQPDKELTRQVEENLKKLSRLGIYRPPYDKGLAPLYRYLKDEKKTLTLLKLKKIEEDLLDLKDIKLRDETAPTCLPQGFYYIRIE